MDHTSQHIFGRLRQQSLAIVMGGQKARLMATDPLYLVNCTGGNHRPSANRSETGDENWDEYMDPESAIGFYVAFLKAGMAT